MVVPVAGAVVHPLADAVLLGVIGQQCQKPVHLADRDGVVLDVARHEDGALLVRGGGQHLFRQVLVEVDALGRGLRLDVVPGGGDEQRGHECDAHAGHLLLGPVGEHDLGRERRAVHPDGRHVALQAEDVQGREGALGEAHDADLARLHLAAQHTIGVHPGVVPGPQRVVGVGVPPLVDVIGRRVGVAVVPEVVGQDAEPQLPEQVCCHERAEVV
mmetsp:Transcript_106688/g.296948  ORF Transcript_106688/g.296948 Transcript_106688/m.296948 type:complete len:215 (+) Transcript_106688:409-1053(+)